MPRVTSHVLYSIRRRSRQVFLKYYHPEQLAHHVLRALRAYLFIQTRLRRVIAMFRFRRLLAESRRQREEIRAFLLFAEVSMID